MKRFRSCCGFQPPTFKPHFSRLCPSDSLKVMICLTSTCFPKLPGLLAFICTLHMVTYSYGQSRAEHCHGIPSPGLFDNYAGNGLLKNNTAWGSFAECGTYVTPRSRSNAKPRKGLCLKPYVV